MYRVEGCRALGFIQLVGLIEFIGFRGVGVYVQGLGVVAV